MILVFGGTFDPVHKGHLTMASELSAHFKGVKVFLMPCYKAVHKVGVTATAEQRVAMLKLAIAQSEHLALDLREINRGAESYSYLSLSELRKENPNSPIVFVMGTDAALGLDVWRLVNKLPQICHLLVLRRPGVLSEAESITLLDKIKGFGWSYCDDVMQLKMRASGCFSMLKLSSVDVSSSMIRDRLLKNESTKDLLSDDVIQYICDNGLYRSSLS